MIGGRKRNLVSIQQVTETKNSYGERVETWSVYAKAWASVTPVTGKEYYQAQAAQAEATHKVVINYLSGVVPKMRILFGSRILLIESVLNDGERNRELVLMCVEHV